MYVCEPPPCVYSSAAQAQRPPRRRYRSRRTLLPPIKTAERNYVWIAANLMAAGGYWEELRARVACIRIPRAAAYVCPKPGASSNHTLERRGGGRRVGVRAPARGDVARAARHTRGTAPAWCRLPVARRGDCAVSYRHFALPGTLGTEIWYHTRRERLTNLTRTQTHSGHWDT